MARRPVKRLPVLDYELGAFILVSVDAVQEAPIEGERYKLSANVDYSEITQEDGKFYCELSFQCSRTAGEDLPGVEINATYGIAFTCAAEQSEDVVKVVAATVAWTRFSDLVATIDAHMRRRLPPLPVYAIEVARVT